MLLFSFNVILKNIDNNSHVFLAYFLAKIPGKESSAFSINGFVLDFLGHFFLSWIA